jgi:hypothetical protein
VSARRRQRELDRWEAETRTWAMLTGRVLALALSRNTDVPVQPYSIGLVLWEGEKVWAQVPARCSADAPLAVRPGPPRRWGPAPQPRISDWLVTNHRVAGRLYPDALTWWEWCSVVGVKVDLTPRAEYLQIDLASNGSIAWTGAGVAPLAVAAVFQLHGAAALIDHPGLTLLRASTPQTAGRRQLLGIAGELESAPPSQCPLIR